MNDTRTRMRGTQQGMSLVELMVALSIGTFLLAGAITVFGKTRDLYRTNDAAARLQETARYAMGTIEADLRMANYWGLMSRSDMIENGPRLDPANPPAVDPTYSLPAELTGFAGTINQCGAMWAIKLPAYVEANNGAYGFACAAFGTAVPGSDQLTIRRVSTQVIDPAALGASAGQIKIQTQPRAGHAVLERHRRRPATCRRFPRPARSSRHGYYVDQNSDERNGTPSLRRKQLDVAGDAPAITDLQIVPGVEDLQIELGADFNGDQNADYFVQPNAAIPAGDLIVAVRVWLLVRAEQQESGFTDGTHLHLCEPRRRGRLHAGGCVPAGSRQQDHRAQEYTSMNGKSFGFQRQQGAALVIGLILLLVLTILAVSGVFTSTMELRMVRNNQSQERSFQAAEVAIEDALANPVLARASPFNQATIAVPNSPGDTYSYRLQFVGQAPLGTGMTGYSIGTSFQTYHFQVDSTGNGPDNAVSQPYAELLRRRPGHLTNLRRDDMTSTHDQTPTRLAGDFKPRLARRLAAAGFSPLAISIAAAAGAAAEDDRGMRRVGHRSRLAARNSRRKPVRQPVQRMSLRAPQLQLEHPLLHRQGSRVLRAPARGREQGRPAGSTCSTNPKPGT